MPNSFEFKKSSEVEQPSVIEVEDDSFEKQLDREQAELDQEVAEVEKLQSTARSKMDQLRSLGYNLAMIIGLFTPVLGSEAEAQETVKQVLFSETTTEDSLSVAPEQESLLATKEQLATLRERLVNTAKPYMITLEEIKQQLKSPLFEGCDVKIIPDSWNLKRGFADELIVHAMYLPPEHAIYIKPLRADERLFANDISFEYFLEHGDDFVREASTDKRGLHSLEALNENKSRQITLDSLSAQVINDTSCINRALKNLEIKKNYYDLSEGINHEAFHHLYSQYFFTEYYEGPTPEELMERLKLLIGSEDYRDFVLKSIEKSQSLVNEKTQGMKYVLDNYLSFSDIDFGTVLRTDSTFMADFKDGVVWDYRFMRKIFFQEESWNSYCLSLVGNLLDEYLARIYDCSKGSPDDIYELDEWEQNFMKTVKLKGVALADIPKIEIPLVKIPASDSSVIKEDKIEEMVK